MTVLERLNHRPGFTRSETYVVLFLVGMLLLGGAIKLVRSATNESDRFDYTKADEEFARQSQLLALADSSIAPPAAGDAEGRNIEPAPTQTKPTGRSKTKAPPKERIDINSASKAELMQLPGVGEATAERIVLYREEHGAFKRAEDLTKVKGIGKKKLERLAPYITIGKE
jgi:competence ComEA-like helix-hairpin-helix protein